VTEGTSAQAINAPSTPSKMKWRIRQKDGLLWTYTTHLYGDQNSSDEYGINYRIQYSDVVDKSNEEKSNIWIRE
jgi:hypothetical protein